MIRFLLAAQLLLSASAMVAAGTPTTVTVRAVSRDAKVIGDGVGGARITIRDVATGKTLATGMQRGGTGDTDAIMKDPRKRGASVYASEGAAAFVATLDLERPTNVEIIAEGPLKVPQATQRASKTMLLIPGRHITGEGVILEVHGFIVEILSAATATGHSLNVRAKVTMTCGCPTEPGGLWDADRIEITARVMQGGAVVGETILRYSGETSTFSGTVTPLAPGYYELEVVAADASNANFGRAVQELRVEENTGRPAMIKSEE